MTYKINGTELTLQPTTGRWQERESLGMSGQGHPIYSAVRIYELHWGLMSASEFNQLHGMFNSVWNTGTAVVELPKYGNATYAFYAYSGCTLQEPEVGDYFEQYLTDVVLLVTNIRT